MRHDHFLGLPEKALKFLERYGIRCPHCKQVMPNICVEAIGHYASTPNNKYPLMRYLFANDRHADEFLQVDPWSGGSILFLGLKVSDGTEYLWTQEEIDECSQ